MISQATIEEIKDKANLVDIIGESVTLRRQGASYVGLCPFHTEKSPSFHVRDGKFYHCFGCGASGNAVSYIMHTKGLSFPQAIEDLAERYGITIVNEKGKNVSRVSADRSVYFEINKLALGFFMHSLKSAPPQVGEYVSSRGLSDEIISSYGIGFSPLKWSALVDFLKSKKIEDEKILSLGLARRNSRGELYDALRGRLVFPIWSDNRKVAGFGGRLIPAFQEQDSSKSSPKYINSPESPVYQKNRILFGLPQAMPAIRTEKEVYIVEGYMDVVTLWGAGVRNVLATCGTALTENHVKRLAYLTKKVFILFDGDDAGKFAASKAFTVFLNSGIDVSILFLPQSEDPDSLARKLGPGMKDYLKKLDPELPINCFIDALLAKYSAASVKDLGAALKGQITQEVSALLSKVKNPVEREELIRQAAFKLMVQPEHIVSMGNAQSARDRGREQEKNREQGEAGAAPAAPEEPQVRADLSIKPVESLPALDRELLLAVMALKESLTGRVLHDPDLCEVLQFSSLNFVEELDMLLRKHAGDIAELKEQIKALLRQYGESWSAHWRLAHEIIQDPGSRLVQTYDACKRAAKKAQVNQMLIANEEQIKRVTDEAQRVELYQKSISLRKVLNSL